MYNNKSNAKEKRNDYDEDSISAELDAEFEAKANAIAQRRKELEAEAARLEAERAEALQKLDDEAKRKLGYRKLVSGVWNCPKTLTNEHFHDQKIITMLAQKNILNKVNKKIKTK